MFDDTDILNVVLQRSQVLFDVPRGGRLIRKWTDGDGAPLEHVIDQKGDELVKRAIAMTYIEYQTLRQHLPASDISSVADIGCGYAFIDLFISRDFSADLTLIDIEESEVRDFGFQQEGAGYSNLRKARAFLVANGVPSDKISLVNPNKTDVTTSADVNLAISLLSCGFHYPVATYSAYFAKKLTKGGTVILDIRDKNFSEQADAIAQIGDVTEKYEVARRTKRFVISKR
jgi:SAM-dependent methyltransferase